MDCKARTTMFQSHLRTGFSRDTNHLQPSVSALMLRAFVTVMTACVVLGVHRPACSASLPSGFIEQTVGSGWNEAVGLTFAADGRMFVWERGGLVWSVTNGVKSAQPFLDIQEEVANWGDFGLLGFCLDPDFATNGRVYYYKQPSNAKIPD